MEFHNDAPIFVQIADQIENAIMSGALKEEEQAPSTTEISVHMKINPATALKGVNKLVEEGVLYKKEDWVCSFPMEPEKKSKRRERSCFLRNMSFLCSVKLKSWK